MDETTQKERQIEWEKTAPKLKVKRGILYRYARDVAVSTNPHIHQPYLLIKYLSRQVKGRIVIKVYICTK